MTTWYLKIQDNLVKFKDRFFRPADYINLNEFVAQVIAETPVQQAEISPINYSEFTYTGENITKKEVYEDNTLASKLYTFNYTYTGDNLTQIEVIRESDSYTYYKDLSYDINGNLENIDIHE